MATVSFFWVLNALMPRDVQIIPFLKSPGSNWDIEKNWTSSQIVVVYK